MARQAVMDDNGTMRFSWTAVREYLFYLFVFSLPWQTRWIIRDPLVNGGVWEYGRVSLYGWDILLVLLLVLNWSAVVRAAGGLRAAAAGRSVGQARKAFLFSALLVAYAFAVSPWALGQGVALAWAVRLLAGTLGWWLLVRAVKPKFEYVLATLAAAGTLQAIWAAWQLAAQATFASKWLGVAVHPLSQGGTSVVLTSAGRWLRAYAGQVHPNVLGGLLAVTLLATAWLYVTESREQRAPHQNRFGTGQARNKRLILLIAYAVQLAGLFASFSRGAWLALLLSLVLWWWRVAEARARLRPVVLTTLAVFVLLAAGWWQPVFGRLVGGSRLEQQSVEERVGGWHDSRELLSTGWWWGVGLGGYTAALIARDATKPSYAYQPVHNVPLLALLELGLAGFVLLLATLWHRLAPFAIRRHLLLLPIFFTSLFDHYWWTVPSMVVLAWLLVALRERGVGES